MSARRDDFDTKMKKTHRNLRAAGRNLRELQADGELDALLSDAEARVMSVRRARVRSRRGTMARATGGDVIVRLLHEAGQFKVMLGEHATRLAALERRMDVVASRMDAVASQMGAVAGRVDSLSDAMSSATQNIEALTAHARDMSSQFGKVYKLLVEATRHSESRFEAVEQRLSRLEAKA